jgi:hypothetical protein
MVVAKEKFPGSDSRSIEPKELCFDPFFVVKTP